VKWPPSPVTNPRRNTSPFAPKWAEEFLISGLVEETDCLVLDLRMPGMNGLELQRRLAEGSNALPIIFLSARSTPDDERQALQSGAFQFLQKPVGKEVLLTAIRNAIDSALGGKKGL
jgi:FixJ family two-component response regulator